MDLDGKSALIDRESFLRDEIVQLATEVEVHRRRFDKFRQEAFPEDVSQDLSFAKSSEMIPPDGHRKGGLLAQAARTTPTE